MKLSHRDKKLKISSAAVLLLLVVAISVSSYYAVFSAAPPKTSNNSVRTTVPAKHTTPANLEETPATPASLTFFNVGHGDSSLIQYKDKTILVDTGKPEDHIAQRLLEKGVSKIDYLIITHDHPDHIGGLPEIQDNLEIGTLIQNGSFEGEFFRVIKPPQVYENENDNSLLISFVINGKKVLIMGDSELESQRDFVDTFKRNKEKIYLLKYPHHGVDDFPLYLYLKPEITVISSGTDGVKYNIPQYVIREQEEIGSKVYWTARDADIDLSLP